MPAPSLETAMQARESGEGFGAMEGRYKLLRVAQWVRYRKDRGVDQDRVCWCHRTVANKWAELRVKRRKDGLGARVTSVMQCGQIWVCPVCAFRICALRAAELSRGMVEALKLGMHAYLLTLTFPHTAADALAELLERQARALKKLKNSRAWKGMRERHAWAGQVRSLEVTWGLNGFHPHTHDLIFAAPGMLEDRAAIRRLKCEWLRQCHAAGLIKTDGTLKPWRDFWRHAFDLRGGDRAAEYVAKYGRDEAWGMSSELTAAHAKIGIRRTAWSDDQHFTPFQLLEWARNGDSDARRAFNEFADAIADKRALSWSPHLKKRLGIAELEDDELLEQPLAEEEDAGVITTTQYAVLVARDAYVEFVRFVAECCSDPATAQQDIDTFIAWLERTRPPTYSDTLRRPSAGRDDDGRRQWQQANYR